MSKLNMIQAAAYIKQLGGKMTVKSLYVYISEGVFSKEKENGQVVFDKETLKKEYEDYATKKAANYKNCGRKKSLNS